MEIKILKPEEISQPRVKAVVEETNEKDWVKDGPILGATFIAENLFPDKDLTPYITEMHDLQRNDWFDEYCCVIHGTINNVQLLANKKYGITLDLSKRSLALETGVVPGQGTSIRAASETLRTVGVALEKDYPTINPGMTQQEFFTPIKGVPEYFLASGFEYAHTNLPNNYLGATMESLIDSNLVHSGVIVAIEGRYTFDDQGRLQYSGGNYAHVVLVVKSQPDCFLVLDSENPNGLMKVRRDYNFSSPKIAYLKKTMKNLYRKVGQPAIGLYVPDNGGIFLYRDGKDSQGNTVAGGSIFKALQLTYSMAQQVSEWPYPVRGMFGIDPITGAITLDEESIN